MKVCFIYAEKDGEEECRELTLAKAFVEGVVLAGDEAAICTKSEAHRNPPDAESVCMVGVKSLKLFKEMQALGKQIIYFDKGYLRHRGPNRTWEYWRVTVNDHHPTHYVTVASHGHDRWQAIAKRRLLRPAPWRTTGDKILYAGSSEKYHAFVGLPDPTEYATYVIGKLKKYTDKLIVYRPKPTWEEATPIKGSQYSPRAESIEDALQYVWCVVTNGSNASFDATMAGIPCIVLGNAIAKPIYSHKLEDVKNPPIPSGDERDQWLANLAWCMFTEAEMRAGLAWQAIRPQLEGCILDDSSLEENVVLGMRPTKGMLKRAGLWKKALARPKRTKEAQRALKPFTKTKTKS